MRFTQNNSTFAKSNSQAQLKVLEAARLRSELAAYIWSQTMEQRQHGGPYGSPKPGTDFNDQKKALTEEVLKLAGQKIGQNDLINSLKKIIGQGTDEALHRLDAKTMASKISVRV